MTGVLTVHRALAAFAATAGVAALRLPGFPGEIAGALLGAAAWRIASGARGSALLGPRWLVGLRALTALATLLVLAGLARGALPPLTGLVVLLSIVETLTLLETQTPFTSFLALLFASAMLTSASFVHTDGVGLGLALLAFDVLLLTGLLFADRMAALRGTTGLTAGRRVRLGPVPLGAAPGTLRTLGLLTGGALLVGGLLFVLLPRVPSWGRDAQDRAAAEAARDAEGAATGPVLGPDETSKGMSLGDVGTIKHDLTPYFEVRLPPGRTPFLREKTYDVYLPPHWTAWRGRGAAAAYRVEAQPPQGRYVLSRTDDAVRGYDAALVMLRGGHHRLYVERDVVWATILRRGRPVLTGLLRHDNEQIDALEPFETGDVLRLRVVPPVTDPLALERARSDAATSPRPSYLVVPEACAPLAPIAASVVGGETSPWRRARMLVGWLQGPEFAYTLEMPVVDGSHPVVDFVLRNRRGHCEYFAAALTLLLRSLGHPSRIALGFRGGDWQEARGSWIVRGSNYHAWTEVHLEGLGWIPLDATPPDREAVDAATRTREADAGDGTGRDRAAHPDFLEALFGITPEQREQIERFLSDLLERYVLGPLGFLFSRDALFLGPLLSLLAVGLYGQRRRREAWRREAGARSRREALGPYLSALRVLARGGLRRRRSETPREFLATVQTWAPDVRDDLAPLTYAHEAVRYGSRRLAPEGERRAWDHVSHLTAVVRQRGRGKRD